MNLEERERVLVRFPGSAIFGLGALKVGRLQGPLKVASPLELDFPPPLPRHHHVF